MVLTAKNIVALAGGVGGSKLAYGLAKRVAPEKLTIIGNVGDDFEHYGLHISPDLDTLMYTLGEVANPETGWGLAGETWQMLDMLSEYGERVWFRLGDRDLATHVLRTEWLRQGVALTEVTARLARSLGVQPRLLPVTDDPLATLVDTEEYGTLPFQAYFVRYRWQPTARRIWYHGAERARATDAVMTALHEADVIVLCPSNPILSIEPILAIPGVREALQVRRGFSVAVSPFIGGRAVKGPAAKLMGELGLGVTPQDLIQYYAGVLDGLVIDVSDREQTQPVDFPILITHTLMESGADKMGLAAEILSWVEGVRQ